MSDVVVCNQDKLMQLREKMLQRITKYRRSEVVAQGKGQRQNARRYHSKCYVMQVCVALIEQQVALPRSERAWLLSGYLGVKDDAVAQPPDVVEPMLRYLGYWCPVCSKRARSKYTDGGDPEVCSCP